MRRIFPGSRKPMHYIISIFVTHHYEVWRSCWADMRKVLDGEWGELQWFIHLRNEKKNKLKGKGLYSFGIRYYKVVGVLRESDLWASFNDRVWRHWKEDIDSGRGMHPELLNRRYKLYKNIKWSQHILITDLMTSENYYTSWHVFE